jgi:CpeT protein
VYLTSNNEGKYYERGTHEKSCLSDLRGASYAVSAVELYEDKLLKWDKVLDKADIQIWGATKVVRNLSKRNDLL